MNRKRWIQLSVLIVLLVAWFSLNPPRRFGWACYAFTVYSGFPRPLSDFQVRADGSVRTIEKTHDLSRERIEWLLADQPDIVIISIGWDGVVQPTSNVKEIPGVEVRVLKNREAKSLFNELKRAGKRVAIHYHSTC